MKQKTWEHQTMKIDVAQNGKPLVGFGTASTAAKWLKNHKQTNNGKAYENIN
jgi:hypothetical protein